MSVGREREGGGREGGREGEAIRTVALGIEARVRDAAALAAAAVVARASQVLMTWVKETERRTSETLVQRVPHSSSTEDTVSCLRHAHHRAGSRSLPKAKAAGSARPPAIICRLVSSMTSGRRAWERFIPMLKKRLATYQTAMRVGSALAPV